MARSRQAGILAFPTPTTVLTLWAWDNSTEGAVVGRSTGGAR